MPDAVDGVRNADVQDIRLAVVMNGGVSLAVWISGVTLELHRLATAQYGTSRAYLPLLEMLRAKAGVDVVAGTSAGGINGAFLALGLARRTGIEAMRDLWRDQAAIGRLLRDPLEKHPPSVLKGDSYFLPQVRQALRNIAEEGVAAVDADQGPTSVELILTGTLWRGRKTSFSDDMGVRITELDRDARFRFGWRADGSTDGTVRDLNAESAVDELAAAARCTSSFPAAFEPHWVQVSSDHSGGERSWQSQAGAVNFPDSQYVIDGGLLLNKPVRPALEAVYRQPAQLQVRRVLAYVVPDPGEQPPQEQSAALPDPEGVTSPPPGPNAPEVLLGVLTRLRATDSVSRELEEIRRRNAAAHIRRRARDRFATALVQDAGSLAAAAWPAYIEVRIDNAARTIGQLLAVGQRSEGAGRWSETDLLAQIRSLLGKFQQGAVGSFIPQPGPEEAVERTGAAWDWGQSTVLRLRDMAVDVLKRAVWLAPMNSSRRADIVAARARVSDVFRDVQADGRSLEDYWATASARLADPIPARATDALGRASNTSALRAWLRTALTAWDEQPGGVAERRSRQHCQAAALARHLADCADSLAEIVENGNSGLDPDGSERGRLQALYECLLAPHSGKPAAPEIVLRRMLRLEVVQLAFSGAAPDVEQEVELIQFSARKPALITGKQLHHFGAFWRSSWRVNDWIHGRLDGAAHIVRMLLSPERLRQLGTTYGSAEPMVRDLRACAVAADNPADLAWLEQLWQDVEEQVHGYVSDHLVPPAAAAGPDPTPPDPRLNTCIEAITRSLQLRILREDLDSLAAALRHETADITEGRNVQKEDEGEADQDETDVKSITRAGREWLACHDAKQTPLSPHDLWDLWDLAADIGRETIRDDRGSDYFARTVAQAAAVTANVARTATSSGFLNKIKPVGTVLDAFRGYALAVWAMVAFLTRGGNFGRNTVHLVLAVGGALLGVSMVVPAVPLVFPLVGALLLTAGWSAAALLAACTRPVGWRLLPLALLVLVVFAAYVAWELHDQGPDNLVGFLIKAAVVVLVVLLGWWIARASRPSKRGSASDAAADGEKGQVKPSGLQ